MKYPAPGTVKTRIAKEWGQQRATELHRELVRLTLENIRSTEWMTWCMVSPSEALNDSRAWLGQEWRLYPQEGDELGERFINAFTLAFQQGTHRIIAIGTDSPWLGVSQIREAFCALQNNDLVIGPAEDGGYYLIGLSSFLPGLSIRELFKGIDWGTDQVSRQTCDVARRLKLKKVILSKGYDIDTVKDYERFLKSLGSHARRVGTRDDEGG